jgi:hypothetical protein
MTEADPTKKIAPGAYDALVDALSLVFWNKGPFERFVKLALQDHPELLAGLSFDDPKRQVASELVMRLAKNEPRYQAVSLDLMLEVARFEAFPNLERQVDRVDLIANATSAVATLRTWTEKYGEVAQAHAKLREEQKVAHARADARRAVQNLLDELKQRFLSMYSDSDPQLRGRTFEGLLNDLFALFDLNPRKSFAIADEQIDGAFTFNTDDYILEAKWEKTKASREDADILAQKVERKGRNTLGLFIAIEGFSQQAVNSHSNRGTGLIFMDGADLMSILEGQVSLTEVLDAKRRHVSETGRPLLHVREMFG